ncbi:MAG: permease [Spirochaetales bacterium]|nr:permease [Spirochaetales bacterium]
MKKEPQAKKNPVFPWLSVLAIGGICIFLLIQFPYARENFSTTVYSYGIEMITVFPAVLILMGLLTVLVSKEFITRHLGEGSGIRGFFIALFLGTLPTGPVYMAFPLAAAFRKKGARTANLVIFLSAWACIKLPQELVELRFLGVRFMITRLVLTISAVFIMGLLVEKLTPKESENRHSPA